MGKMVDKEGNNVSGIFNMSKMLNLLLSKFKPEHCLICWDNGKSARYKLYPEYKAGRRSTLTEEEIANINWQMRMCKSIFKNLPVKQVEAKNVEADDVIGYLTSKLDGRKVIVSNDRDFLQLIKKDCHVYLPNLKKVIHHKNADKFLGFPHDRFLLSKAIQGDSSDNIKGVFKMGPVKTAKLLAEPHFKLPDEWSEVINRNLQLMSIGDILTSSDVKAIRDCYKSEFNKELNPIRTRMIFTNLRLRSIVSRYNHWILPFKRLKNGN
jgi:DNA polymerase I